MISTGTLLLLASVIIGFFQPWALNERVTPGEAVSMIAGLIGIILIACGFIVLLWRWLP